MKIKIATLGTVISLACASTTCHAENSFKLDTVNQKDSISTLSIDTLTGGCSDKAPMNIVAQCTSNPDMPTGETGASDGTNYGKSECILPIEGLKTACAGSSCHITVYEGEHCSGSVAGTATLHVANNNITMSDISGDITYTGNGSEGTMTVTP